MTLTTRIRIVEPTPIKPIWVEARRIIGGEHAEWFERPPEYDYDNPGWFNRICQGLPALLGLYYGPDGPLRHYPHELNCEAGECSCPPQASIEVWYDTAYSYHAPNGAGCSDLHAYLVRELGGYLDSRGLTWWWNDESRCEWHRGADDLPILGNADRGALVDDARGVVQRVEGVEQP